jgi:hypothetical protein
MSMPSDRYQLDLSRIRVSEEEILADLIYPAQPRSAHPQPRRRGRRQPRRRLR